ncbi:MAG: hypothetical protein WDW38_005900 [Sanguina aurantia]
MAANQCPQAQEVQRLAQETRPAIEQLLVQSSHRLSSVMASDGVSSRELPAAPLQRLSSEFDALVGDYKRVNADLAHARFQEENFKALNQEMIDD